MIYLDHAATSWPKPAVVLDAMANYLKFGGNPGRSGHKLARASEAMVWNARERVAGILGVTDPERIIFTLNATMALNIAIKGLVEPGARVLTSSFEHNSVVRPLHALTKIGVTWIPVPPARDLPIDLERLDSELQRGDVGLVVIAHASNVTGSTNPIEIIHRLTQEHGAILVVDAAQTVGHRPVSAKDADVLVFAGHKGLLGPQGTGGMYVSEGVTIRSLLQGGSGGRSELPEHPAWLPDALESGTPNGVGIAGLGAAAEFVAAHEVNLIFQHESSIRRRFVDGISETSGVTVYECSSHEQPAAVVSITFRGLPSTEAASLLEEDYGLLTRGGLHCAPLAHKSIGTFTEGSVRFSFSYSTSAEDVEKAILAVGALARRHTSNSKWD